MSSRRSGRASPQAPLALVATTGIEATLTLADAIAPEHLELVFEGADETRRQGAHRRLRVSRRGGATAFGDYAAGSNHVLPTGGAARFGGPLGPGPSGAAPRSSACRAPRPRRSRPTWTRSPARRAFPCTASRLWPRGAWPDRAKIARFAGTSPAHIGLSPHSRDRPQDPARRRSRVAVDLDGGDVAPRPAWGSSTTCSSRSAATAGSACGSRRRATSRPAPTTRSRTSASPSGRRSTRRSGDRAGIRRYGYMAIPMDEALGVCAIDVSGRPLCLFEADLPPPRSRASTPSSTEEFFRAVATNAKLTLHLGTRYGSNAHHMIEACFKAFASALREAVSIDPDEPGVPSTKGTLTVTRHRRSSTTAWETCARSRRRSSGSAPRRVITGDPDAAREADGIDPARAWGRSRAAMRRVRELGLDALVAERLERRHAGARHLPWPSAPVRALDGARRRRRARSAAGRGHGPRGTRAQGPAHRLGAGAMGARARSCHDGLATGTPFYFVHSFAVRPADRRRRPGNGRVGRAVRLRGGAAAALRRPVPPREVERRGPAAAGQLRRDLRRRFRRDPLSGDRHPRRPRRSPDQGDYDRETVYDADPLDAARRWLEQGARALHVVDLDGARSGQPENLEHVARIAAEAGGAGAVRRRPSRRVRGDVALEAGCRARRARDRRACATRTWWRPRGRRTASG